MGSIVARPETGKLFFDFRYKNKRCREQTALEDTPVNRRKLEGILKKIEAEITLGSFEYARYFPGSRNARQFSETENLKAASQRHATPLFSDFADTWFAEMRIQWRKSHVDTVESTLRSYLKHNFGEKEVGSITKAEILSFRSQLAKVRYGKDKPLSAERINHIMTPLRMILNEAADRYEFTSPYLGIKSLKVPRVDVAPFTLEEVRQILATVREDYRNYYTVRFFTGMRTGEIDGLQWQFVDFDRRQILVRQALVNDEMVYTKNDGSFRSIDMSGPVFDALLAQKEATGKFDYVFCSRTGSPLAHRNITQRVWYPLLRHLGLQKRRPYQTRHTAATLWLAAGEAPEWIARQMGHTTTEMLFRVYSRYVPNLTRRDGSAMERLLLQALDTPQPSNEETTDA
ncbi:MAG: integrase [Pseudomonadales bacterium]|nr:integrase [Pseudomonadales bacterium]